MPSQPTYTIWILRLWREINKPLKFKHIALLCLVCKSDSGFVALLHIHRNFTTYSSPIMAEVNFRYHSRTFASFNWSFPKVDCSQICLARTYRDVGLLAKQCIGCQSVNVHTHVKAPLESYPPPHACFDHVNIDMLVRSNT